MQTFRSHTIDVTRTTTRLALERRYDQTSTLKTRDPLANGRPSHPEKITDALHIHTTSAVQVLQKVTISEIQR
jgi:hypothetical protein